MPSPVRTETLWFPLHMCNTRTHIMVYEAFAHDAQDLWKASYGYFSFSLARMRHGKA